MTPAAALLWLALPLAAGEPAQPEDLGPGVIDVSGYPPEHRRAYQEVFLPVMDRLGHPERVVNSPLVELDPAAAAAERRAHPELFGDPLVAAAAPHAWKDWVAGLRNRPGCCYSCLNLTKANAVALWRFLAFDSVVRKTGANAEAWVRHRRGLLERFAARGAGDALKEGGESSR